MNEISETLANAVAEYFGVDADEVDAALVEEYEIAQAYEWSERKAGM